MLNSSYAESKKIMNGLLLISFFSVVLEMLPISSSTHIALLTQFLERLGIITSSPAIFKAFDFLLHGPMIIILIIFFFNRWRALPRFFYYRPASFINYVWCGVIVEMITLLFFLLFDYIEFAWWNLWIGFSITSLALLSDYFLGPQSQSTKWNTKNACILGVAQGFAFLPGVSRFGITFAAARSQGFSLRHAFELSFLIEFPISCVATLKGIYDLYKLNALNLLNWQWWLTMVIATSIAFILLHGVYGVIIKRRWWLFGWYAAFLAVVAFVNK
jgi:undecaprenyl-diphosphatase